MPHNLPLLTMNDPDAMCHQCNSRLKEQVVMCPGCGAYYHNSPCAEYLIFTPNHGFKKCCKVQQSQPFLSECISQLRFFISRENHNFETMMSSVIRQEIQDNLRDSESKAEISSLMKRIDNLELKITESKIDIASLIKRIDNLELKSTELEHGQPNHCDQKDTAKEIDYHGDPTDS